MVLLLRIDGLLRRRPPKSEAEKADGERRRRK